MAESWHRSRSRIRGGGKTTRPIRQFRRAFGRCVLRTGIFDAWASDTDDQGCPQDVLELVIRTWGHHGQVSRRKDFRIRLQLGKMVLVRSTRRHDAGSWPGSAPRTNGFGPPTNSWLVWRRPVRTDDGIVNLGTRRRDEARALLEIATIEGGTALSDLRHSNTAIRRSHNVRLWCLVNKWMHRGRSAPDAGKIRALGA